MLKGVMLKCNVISITQRFMVDCIQVVIPNVDIVQKNRFGMVGILIYFIYNMNHIRIEEVVVD